MTKTQNPLNPPFQKGETPIPLPFVKGGGEGLFLFQKAKIIRNSKLRLSGLSRCSESIRRKQVWTRKRDAKKD
jgi:hypothetical protein